MEALAGTVQGAGVEALAGTVPAKIAVVLQELTGSGGFSRNTYWRCRLKPRFQTPRNPKEPLLFQN